MLFRCMMILFLLMISVMPAWAGEKDAPPFEISENYQFLWEHIQNRTGFLYDSIDSNTPHDPYEATPYTEDGYYKAGYSLAPLKVKMDTSAYSKIHVTTEDWIDNNTYYIRYTFTNPTDELLEKDVDYISIGYELYAPEKDIISKGQRSDAIRKISLPPHSTTSFVVPLTLKENVSFSSLTNSKFYFTDNTMIDYFKTVDIFPKVMMAPIISTTGDPYLVIKNHHPSKTITNIRNIYSKILFSKPLSNHDSNITERYYLEKTSLPLQLKPQETVCFPLPKSIANVEQGISPYKSYTTAMIDGIKHSFNVDITLTEAYSVPSTYSSYSSNRENTRYFTPSVFDEYNLVTATGTYEVNGSTLNGYLRIKNPHAKIITIHGVRLSSLLEYYTADNTQETRMYRSFFPYRFNLIPGEEKFITFSLTVPEDAATIPRLNNFCLYSPQEGQPSRYLNYSAFLQYKKLPPLQKVLYRPTINSSLQ